MCLGAFLAALTRPLRSGARASGRNCPPTSAVGFGTARPMRPTPSQGRKPLTECEWRAILTKQGMRLGNRSPEALAVYLERNMAMVNWRSFDAD